MRPAGGLAATVSVRRGALQVDVALTAAAGELVALIGPNGAGKTSVLRAVAGLTPLHDGRVALGGQVWDDPAAGVYAPPHQRSVGVVFQDYLLFPHLDVIDNVAFAARARGAARARARAAAQPWLDRLDLADLAHRRPGQLSGGQAQRVALARALAARPSLLLLDEPFAALDAGARAELRTGLRGHLAGHAGPTLLVTHDPLEAMVLADRLVVVESGRVVQCGPPADVARRPVTDYVARLVGLNLYRGRARDGTVELDAGGHLAVADHGVRGAVLVAVRPTAVSLHARRPEGSPRNVWPGVVTGAERLADRVRVALDGAPTALADVTPAAAAELSLVPGRAVWVSVKATELEVYADRPAA